MSYITIKGQPDRLSVSKIVCIGSNYAAHVSEMNSEASQPTEPVIFLKPPSAIIHDGGEIILPVESIEIHHEVEVIVAIGETCSKVPMSAAQQYILGYGIGIDVTLRDLQAAAKSKGKPWSIAKGFDTSAPISEIVPVGPDHVADKMDFKLLVNGQQKQVGNTGSMIFTIPFMISYISKFFTLNEGDLIFTGTPEGVGPIVAGDVIEAELNEMAALRVSARAGSV